MNHYQLEGSTLAYPLYHSPQFGYRLFRQAYLDVATQPASFFLNHPNRRSFDAAFRRMQALSEQHGFQVTVVTVPTAGRLYKDAYEDLPAITEEPHFIRYVDQLADGLGFEHLDLDALLRPYAEHELLFYRDDTHWNERGHEIVAQLLTRHVAAQRSVSAAPVR